MPKPPQGTVTVTPDPCPNGDLYTVTATDVTINGYPNIFVYNGTGVVSVGCSYDADAHTVTGESYAAWPGTAGVEVRDYSTQNGKATIVAEGTFEVV